MVGYKRMNRLGKIKQKQKQKQNQFHLCGSEPKTLQSLFGKRVNEGYRT
jgi:hypothetical protein